MLGFIGTVSDDVLDGVEANLERLLHIGGDAGKNISEQIRHLRQRC